jgi:hypothetical protein
VPPVRKRIRLPNTKSLQLWGQCSKYLSLNLRIKREKEKKIKGGITSIMILCIFHPPKEKFEGLVRLRPDGFTVNGRASAR